MPSSKYVQKKTIQKFMNKWTKCGCNNLRNMLEGNKRREDTIKWEGKYTMILQPAVLTGMETMLIDYHPCEETGSNEMKKHLDGHVATHLETIIV